MGGGGGGGGGIETLYELWVKYFLDRNDTMRERDYMSIHIFCLGTLVCVIPKYS